jgi:putative ABC transport system substrate-binding protein
LIRSLRAFRATQLVAAFKAATTTIPIVGLTYDPVDYGLVSSLARPGGNITGFSVNAGDEVFGKYLELLRQAAPEVSRVAFLLRRAAGRAGKDRGCSRRPSVRG